MTDTVKSWIREPRGIHTKAQEHPYVTPQSSTWWEALKVHGEYERDAKVNFPAALTALEKVLELHEPRAVSFYSSARMLGAEKECVACSREWPCATVRAIEGEINE